MIDPKRLKSGMPVRIVSDLNIKYSTYIGVVNPMLTYRGMVLVIADIHYMLPSQRPYFTLKTLDGEYVGASFFRDNPTKKGWY